MIEATMTQERKWGKVKTVCITFLYRPTRSSLSISARRIGAGKLISSRPKLMTSVRPTERQKYMSRKTASKFWNPHQGEPQMPIFAL